VIAAPSRFKKLVGTTSGQELLLGVLVIGGLWASLINQLRVDWEVNPQYGYGWAVPFLCIFLIARKLVPCLHRQSPPKSQCGRLRLGLWFLALVFAPLHLIEVANPDWRLILWLLALDVVGLTLGLIYLAWGAPGLRRLAFPVLYFLVAIPWPSFLETNVIQGLTRADANATVELLSWLGIPAQPHGNVIEVTTGEVGIDEACSGIRSFQATLMISLFLGALYHLPWTRRLALVLGGFAMSFGFNLVRMSILVWVAAHQGTGAIAKWHDPAGIVILLACFFTLWSVGLLLAHGKKIPSTPVPAAVPADAGAPRGSLRPVLAGLLVWFALVVISVEGWYRWHENVLPPAIRWTVAWPVENPTFKNTAIPERTRQILRYNEGSSATWKTAGFFWQAVYMRWEPGRTALHLIQNHTPQICMTSAGNSLRTISQQEWLAIGDLQLPFMICSIENAAQPTYVYYCAWDDRTSRQYMQTMHLTYGNRLLPVLAGLRNPGQRSLEIVMTGYLDETTARRTLQNELERIIRVSPSVNN